MEHSASYMGGSYSTSSAGENACFKKTMTVVDYLANVCAEVAVNEHLLKRLKMLSIILSAFLLPSETKNVRMFGVQDRKLKSIVKSSNSKPQHSRCNSYPYTRALLFFSSLLFLCNIRKPKQWSYVTSSSIAIYRATRPTGKV